VKSENESDEMNIVIEEIENEKLSWHLKESG
jgi:hypothetical protein